MIPDPVTIEINRGLAEGLERMRKRRVDSLLVVSHDKLLSGIVTIKDLQQNLAKGGRIGDVMSKDPTTIHIGSTVREAVLEMARTGVGYLPVIDDRNKLKGLITRASLVNVLSDVLWSNPEAQPEGSVSDRAKEVQVR
jgi:osmoprotectant transport system ATP-binding protein